MKLATVLIQNVIRLLALVLLALGFMFWTRHYYEYVPLHMGLGIFAVVLLWVLSAIGFAARIKPGLVVGGFLWGLLVLWFGMTMGRLLPGRAHEIVRVLHFLVGLGAIGFAEVLGGRIRRRPQTLSGTV